MTVFNSISGKLDFKEVIDYGKNDIKSMYEQKY